MSLGGIGSRGHSGLYWVDVNVRVLVWVWWKPIALSKGLVGNVVKGGGPAPG